MIVISWGEGLSEIQIFERREPKENSTVILAFPDVGLVGPIAIRHMVKEMEMEEIGHITSDEFPPVSAVHEARPVHPVRLYESNGLIIVASEIPIGPDLISALSKKMVDWIKEIQADRVFVIGGLPHQDRGEVDEPEVHGVPANDDMEDLLEKNGLHVIQEGFITGINGVILRHLADEGMSGVYLMSEAHRNYPDPGAAASVLEVLNKLTSVDVNVEELRKKEEEIRVAARDLMRQTQKAMEQTSKEQEEEMPIMYG